MNTRYELNMDVPPREAIRLMYVSKSRFGGDWNSVPHTHSCTEVFYCVDGRGQFNVEGKMLDVAPDDMVIVNPRTLHTELSYQACPLEYIVLGIEGVEILFNQRDQGYTMVKCGAMREDLLGRALPITPKVMDFAKLAAADSMLNTPNCFGIYVAGLTFKWIKAQGGVAEMERRNREKATLLYSVLDESSLFTPRAAKDSRSITNVTFTLPTPALTPDFLRMAEARG